MIRVLNVRQITMPHRTRLAVSAGGIFPAWDQQGRCLRNGLSRWRRERPSRSRNRRARVMESCRRDEQCLAPSQAERKADSPTDPAPIPKSSTTTAHVARHGRSPITPPDGIVFHQIGNCSISISTRPSATANLPRRQARTSRTDLPSVCSHSSDRIISRLDRIRRIVAILPISPEVADNGVAAGGRLVRGQYPGLFT